MNTRLSVASVVNMETLVSLAREFRTEFEVSSGLIHERLAGKPFIFNADGKDAYPFGGWGCPGDSKASPIAPEPAEATIASTDSSCILLGESAEGSAYAVRAAVCFSNGGAVRGYFRVGPTIVYLTREGAFGIPPLEPYELRFALSDRQIAERIIRNAVEKRILASLMRSPQLSIVMADGSLKHPFDPYPVGPADGGEGCLIGFSKSSSLVASSRQTGAVSEARGPAYAVTQDGPIRTLIAKFSHDGLVFRLDVARAPLRVDRVLGVLLSNDGFCVGYPESLRMAHHLSVFSRSEDTALKAYLTKRYELRNLPSFGLRRITLGSLSNSG